MFYEMDDHFASTVDDLADWSNMAADEFTHALRTESSGSLVSTSTINGLEEKFSSLQRPSWTAEFSGLEWAVC